MAKIKKGIDIKRMVERFAPRIRNETGLDAHFEISRRGVPYIPCGYIGRAYYNVCFFGKPQVWRIFKNGDGWKQDATQEGVISILKQVIRKNDHNPIRIPLKGIDYA